MNINKSVEKEIINNHYIELRIFNNDNTSAIINTSDFIFYKFNEQKSHLNYFRWLWFYNKRCYLFIEIKNSSLERVFLIRSCKNSIASTGFISDK